MDNHSEFMYKLGSAGLQSRTLIIENPIVPYCPNTPNHEYNDFHIEWNSQLPPDLLHCYDRIIRVWSIYAYKTLTAFSKGTSQKQMGDGFFSLEQA